MNFSLRDAYNYDFWVDSFNAAFGSGIVRQNIDMRYPRVQNYLQPQEMYGDGSSNPPLIVKHYVYHQGFENVEPEMNADEGPGDDDFYATILTNPDYTPGKYYPKYQRHTMHYDLPEDPPTFRDPVLDRKPEKIVHYPLEIRRGFV